MRIYQVKIILRDFIFDLNDKFPTSGKILLEGWNILHKIKFMFKKIIQESKGNLKFDKFQLRNIIWLNPQKLDFYYENIYLKSSKFPLKLKGDWDLSKKLINDSLIYKILNQKFTYEKSWEEIEDYNLFINQISNGIIKWDSKEKIDENLREIESIYHQIKKKEDLFKEDHSTEEKKKILEIWKGIGKIHTAIDRNGLFNVVDGINVVIAAKLLHIPIIPVFIIIRHKAWIDFIKELYYFSTNYKNRKLYQEITHPDLQTIPFTHGDLRFKIIKENMSISKGKLLDIGANLGYFTRKFEDEGFNCYAVEVNRLYVYFLIKLKKAEKRNYKIIPKSIFNYKKNQQLNFDVVLALNILHHFLNRKNTYFSLIDLLKRLKTKELYLELHNPKEFKNRKVYKRYSIDEFINFILEHSCLNKAEMLFKLTDGRTIYKLTSED